MNLVSLQSKADEQRFIKRFIEDKRLPDINIDIDVDLRPSSTPDRALVTVDSTGYISDTNSHIKQELMIT